jgi:hypothetical protein
MKLSGLEHTCVLVGAGGLGAELATHLVASHPVIVWVVTVGALLVAGASFALRKGWKPSIS